MTTREFIDHYYSILPNFIGEKAGYRLAYHGTEKKCIEIKGAPKYNNYGHFKTAKHRYLTKVRSIRNEKQSDLINFLVKESAKLNPASKLLFMQKIK